MCCIFSRTRRQQIAFDCLSPATRKLSRELHFQHSRPRSRRLAVGFPTRLTVRRRSIRLVVPSRYSANLSIRVSTLRLFQRFRKVTIRETLNAICARSTGSSAGLRINAFKVTGMQSWTLGRIDSKFQPSDVDLCCVKVAGCMQGPLFSSPQAAGLQKIRS